MVVELVVDVSKEADNDAAVSACVKAFGACDIFFANAGVVVPWSSQRLRRARRFTEAGNIAAAIAEVEKLPNQEEAANWLDQARRYARARDALDRIENAAILQPRANIVMGTSGPAGDMQAMPHPGAEPQTDPAPAPAPVGEPQY